MSEFEKEFPNLAEDLKKCGVNPNDFIELFGVVEQVMEESENDNV